MFKEVLAGSGLAVFAVVGLVLFVAVFVGVALWALSRRGGEVRLWSQMPLADGVLRPVAEGPSSARISEAINSPLLVISVPGPKKVSCGKCAHCDCV